jgi:hypothetical protein
MKHKFELGDRYMTQDGRELVIMRTFTRGTGRWYVLSNGDEVITSTFRYWLSKGLVKKVGDD